MTSEALSASHQLPPRLRVEMILNRLDKLPTLPDVVVRLLAVTDDDDTSARDVTRIVESDVSLTATILRLVRRADLGIRSETMTVARAVTMLGFRQVRNAVLTVHVFEALSRPEENERAAATRRGLWEHALAVACLADFLAETVAGSKPPGEAFVCGLLHDIGKIALDAVLPKSYARVVERVERHCACICDVEREILGMDHTVAGRRLASRWGLPPAVIECVWLHHQDVNQLPSGVAFPRQVRLTHLADNLVRREGLGFSGYQYIDDVQAALAQLALSENDADLAIQRLPGRMEPYREALGLGSGSPDLSNVELLRQSNRRLIGANTCLTQERQRLSARSDILLAIERLIERCREDDTPGDVCLEASDTVRELLRADYVVTYWLAIDSRFIHLGGAGASEEEATVSILDLNDPRGALFASAIREISAPGLTPAPASFDWIWEQCRQAPPPRPLFTLPFPPREGGTGGMLIQMAEGHVQPPGVASPEWAALTMTLSRALQFSHAHALAERMNEELFEANRRLQTTRRELVRARSLSMIAAMAAGAAHELNNPLSVISGRAQLAAASCPGEELPRTLEIIVEQAHRASQIVSELMHFAKPDPPNPHVHVLRDLLAPLPQRWRTEFSLGPDELSISCIDPAVRVFVDADQLAFALTEIIANAVEATQPPQRRVLVNSPSHASDEIVRMIVEDNGCGMASEVLEHALDPFFSHRAAGRGRGLGLSRAYRMVEINHGRLRLASTPGIGTRVTMELPASPPRA